MHAMEEKQQEEFLPQNESQENVSAGSDVEMIEVNTPNFFGRHFLHLLAVFGIGFLLFIFMFDIYFTPIYIVGRSMQNTINTSATSANDPEHRDLVYYRAKNSYDIGDIIIVDSTDYLPELKSSIIKRVVAKGGQKVTFKIYDVVESESVWQDAKFVSILKVYYKLFVDDNLLEESYVKQSDDAEHLAFKVARETPISAPQYDSSSNYVLISDNIYPAIWAATAGAWALVSESNPVVCDTIIANNQYFACGDNRNESTDCRYFGPVAASAVLGNVRIHVPYGANLFVALWRAIFG